MTGNKTDRKTSTQGQDNKKLALWQRRLADGKRAWDEQRTQMDRRERLYAGEEDKIQPLTYNDVTHSGKLRKAAHVRNICFENIEAQVSSMIPQPKVTARRPEDEKLAEMIENFLRNEIDRLPMEAINDLAERMIPIQGGGLFWVEWDNNAHTHDTIGAVDLRLIHPKQIIPQPGVYTAIEDMDWIILMLPSTKADVKRKWNKDVYQESDSEPDIRTSDGSDITDDAVTVYIGYAKNDDGAIDRYTWVNNIELEDLENYQARRLPVCSHCGAIQPTRGQIVSSNVPDTLSQGINNMPSPYQVTDQEIAATLMGADIVQAEAMGQTPMSAVKIKADTTQPQAQAYDGGPCPYCGSEEWTQAVQEYEQVILPLQTPAGLNIPGAMPALDDDGRPVMRPTLIPYYRPDQYPLILQRSVSVFGQLLGNSDIDLIADQQNTINRMETKIIDRLVKAGTKITLPPKAHMRMDSDDSEVWHLDNVQDRSYIGVYDFKGDLEYEMYYLAQVYDEARQMLGITDSYQGRVDKTATSGKAKEFSAAQAAGRLESKRIMKNWAYSELYKMMFQFWLAYSDEPRPIVTTNYKGEKEYSEFNRYAFLQQDSSGAYYWNDDFMFSCDTTTPLASNREAMWQETRANFESGAFGDPTQLDTLILFWSKMEQLHYPDAGKTKGYLEEKARQQQLQQMQMQRQQMLMQQQQAQLQQTQQQQQLIQAVEQQARKDAQAAINNAGNNQGTP